MLCQRFCRTFFLRPNGRKLVANMGVKTTPALGKCKVVCLARVLLLYKGTVPNVTLIVKGFSLHLQCYDQF
jgi:hypothetical protein